MLIRTGLWAAAGAMSLAAFAVGMSGTTYGAESDRQRFVGTYRLLVTEIRDASGQWARDPNFNSVGYVTYDESGYMGVHIMPRNRARFAGTTPTPAEAQAALRGYTAYFGPYRLHENETDRFIEHDKATGGQINAGSIPIFKRYYEFEGNKLILIPGDNGLKKADARRRLVWERMPDAPLSPEAKKFVGTYRLLYTDRYTVTGGKETADGARTDARAGSVIIYTRSGHMMVHLRNKEGRMQYAASNAPTPEEALESYRTYVGYFGTFNVHDAATPRFLVHQLEGAVNPAMGPELQRFYQFTGPVLRLATPPSTTDGRTTGGYLFWERLPAVR